MVVDDFPTNLDVASGMLGKYKMQVDCVSSGQAALDLIKAGKPLYDAVFMDHMMPEMDGIEATRLIRSLDSDYVKNLPIISLTANALVGNEQMFLDKGFNAFLSKPINIYMLDSIVKKWIRKKSSNELQQEQTEIPAANIPGVNMDAGIDLYGGEMDIYISVLESFAANTPEVLSKLRSLFAGNLTMEKLADYAIIVHGIKSISGTIAAEDINKKALKLETMAKAGNLPGILAENDAFIEDTQTLIQDIINWLKVSAN